MVQRDEELIERINEGDAAAFEILYLRYRDWVYRLAWRFTGNPEDALDVLQETFTYLLKKFPPLTAAKRVGAQAALRFQLTASMTTFLYPAVKHLSFNLRRRRTTSPADEEILAAIPDPTAPATSRPELAAALASLSPEHREVVLMRFVDDMSLDKIAGALAIPSGTVKSRLYRALEILRADPSTREYFLL